MRIRHTTFFRNIVVISIGLSLIGMVGVLCLRWIQVSAISASEWQASSIVADDIFYDNTSMSVSDIQTFLNNLVPSCDTNGTQLASDVGYPSLTHAQYAAQVGWPGPPYVCLRDYYQVPRSDAIVDNFSGSIPSGAMSAAQIIKNAADAYRVSPKALLVKLRLESKGPLILDSWPLQSQYTAAMGYACTDNAPCDPQYAGFYNQVTNAARQIRAYRDNASGYRYVPFQANTIYYNPGPCKTWGTDGCAEWYGNYGTRRDLTYCGSSSVVIANYATAGLYNYTPYQPNQAALNNLYGSGDGCSSYGNRNFWVIWNDWFGPSNTPFLRSWQSGKMYIRSNSGALYYITDSDQLRDLGYGSGVLNGYTTVDDTYVSSHGSSDLPALIQFGDAPEVYYYASGQLHYINYATYQAYGSPVVGQLSASFKLLFSMGSDATTILRDSTNGNVYSAQMGSRRYVVGPNAYAFYGLSSVSTSGASRALLAALPEGAPLAAPGTIIYANDSNYAGMASEDGSRLYPISTDLRNSLQLPTYSTSDRLVKLLPTVSTLLTNLVKDTSGNFYIIDQTFKLPLSPAQKSTLGYDDSYYVTAPPLLLQQLQTRPVKTGTHLIIQIGGDSRIYMADNKELVWFQSYADLASCGYSIDDVVVLTKRFVDTYLTFNDASVLPSGILARASGDTRVYMISTNGSKVPITTSYLFTNIGYSFSWVRVVSPRSLERITTLSTIAPYAIDADSQYWLLYSGTRRLIPPAYQANYSLPQLSAGNQITPWQLTSLPRTYNASRFIRIDATPNVYLVENGSTHLLSLSAYLSLSDNPWNDITPVSTDLFSWLPIGTPRQ